MNPHGSRPVGAAAAAAAQRDVLLGFFGVFRYSRRAIQLVWETNRALLLAMAVLTLVAGLLPAGVAWIGAQIVDAVVYARNAAGHNAVRVLRLVVLEGGLVAAVAAAQRGLSLCQALLRAQLGQRVNVMILEKALTLELKHFEDSEFYDKLTRARREASSRPLSLVMRTFGLVQNAISLLSFAALLVRFSPWAVVVLLLAGVPAFVAETKFSGDAFRLFRWRSPETRMQVYLETVLAREDHAKEVKLFGLGAQAAAALSGHLHPAVSRRSGAGDPARQLGLRPELAGDRDAVWRLCLDRAVDDPRQHHARPDDDVPAVVSPGTGRRDGDALGDRRYVRRQPLPLDAVRVSRDPGRPGGGSAARGPDPGDGVRFEHVSFTYPGATEPALVDIDLHLPPGSSLALVGENGSGKTTLIKLLTRLYSPDSGRILVDGLPLPEWDQEALRERIGVIFQDFTRYQMLVGENVGAGDERYFEDEARWREAAGKGRAADFIERMPRLYQTQLGKWFKDCQELSGGQWQKIALARAFMRTEADMRWYSMSRPRPWMHAPRPRSSSTFAAWRRVASRF